MDRDTKCSIHLELSYYLLYHSQYDLAHVSPVWVHVIYAKESLILYDFIIIIIIIYICIIYIIHQYTYKSDEKALIT